MQQLKRSLGAIGVCGKQRRLQKKNSCMIVCKTTYFFAIILNINIHMMHLLNGSGSSWEDNKDDGRGNGAELETVSNNEHEKCS